MPTKKPSAQPPETFSDLRLSEPSQAAAGLKGVVVATKHLLQEAGPIRSFKAMAKANQKGGFDCMSCAWPDPDGKRSFAEFCENGAKAVADEITTKRVDRSFFEKWTVSALSEQSDYWLGQQGRLVEPMVLRPGQERYEPIGWDEAFALTARELNQLATPDDAFFYTSGRASNEAAFLYQLFVRQFGTNNLPDCSNMCHESSGAGLNETIGIGKGTVTLEDFQKAELIVVIGQNPGTNHPRMLSSLLEAKRNGCRILSVNPLPETGLNRFSHPQEIAAMLGKSEALSDLWLPVGINGDIPLLQAIAKELIARDANIDRAFIDQHTHGFQTYIEHLDTLDSETLIKQSGLPRDQVMAAADLLANSRATIFCWAMGLTQHENGVANIKEVVNLSLLQGNLGKPGAGLCPVRGHSNVQGDRTMGIWEKSPDAFLDQLGAVFEFEPPRHHGLDTIDSIRAMRNAPGKVFFGLGGNFLSATPDTEYTADALRNCALTVHVSTKLNRSHLIAGQQALILPCLGRTEIDVQQSGPQKVTVENSMGVVHSSEGNLAPASPDLLSEPAIVARLAHATLGAKTKADWLALAGDYRKIRDLIEQVIPGFERFNERLDSEYSFYLPNPVKQRVFKTATGKANFSANHADPIELADGEYLMMTIRSHDQFNTTIYGMHDRYRGIFNERRVVLMNIGDMKAAGIERESVVDLVSEYDGEERLARQFKVVAYRIPPRCIATYFPEANVLVPITRSAAGSNTPISKSVVTRIRKANRPPQM